MPGIEAPEFSAMWVATPPGKTTVTATDVPRSSAYRPSVRSMTAAFEAPYTDCPGTGTKAPMLETLTSAASRRSVRCVRKARVMCTTPQKFTAMTFSTSTVLEVREGHERLDDARDVEQAVDVAVRGDHRGGQRLHRGALADVDGVRAEPLAGGSRRGRGAGEPVGAQVDGGDPGSASEQPEHHLATDPVAATRDDEDLPGDVHDSASQFDSAATRSRWTGVVARWVAAMWPKTQAGPSVDPGPG